MLYVQYVYIYIYIRGVGLNPSAATKCNIFANGEACCYSECVEPPKRRYKLDTKASCKKCCLLHNDSTATVVTYYAHTIYSYKYIRQLHNCK